VLILSIYSTFLSFPPLTRLPFYLPPLSFLSFHSSPPAYSSIPHLTSSSLPLLYLSRYRCPSRFRARAERSELARREQKKAARPARQMPAPDKGSRLLVSGVACSLYFLHFLLLFPSCISILSSTTSYFIRFFYLFCTNCKITNDSVYHRLSPSFIIYHRLSPSITIYHHLPPSITTYHLLSPVTAGGASGRGSISMEVTRAAGEGEFTRHDRLSSFGK
jgi:hypothetical protein